MSISRRTSLTVRSVGVASAAAALALGVAGTASACNIRDFSFTGSVTCDQSSGTGVITVHDTDSTRPVTITVKDDSGKQVAQQPYNDRSSDFAISVPWTAGAHYQVLASVAKYFDNQAVGNGVTLPNTECGAGTPSTSPSASPSTSPSSAPSTAPTSEAPSSSPTAVASTSAAAVADTSSPSPSGNLAETGGGSNTGMIAGIAGALVVVGGGAVFGLRRRAASARH